MAFDVVLLDLYDTIAWSEWFRLRDRIAARTGLDDLALARAFEATRPLRGVGAFSDAFGDMAAVVEAAGLDPAPDLIRELVDLEREELTHRVHLYDDTLPALSALRELGIPTALVSNCSHSTRPVVERLELERMFDAVILSFEVGAMKPDPAIYRAALSALGADDPSRSVFVDDQPAYCDGAAAIGQQTRLMLRANEDAPQDTGGHPVVTDLRWLG
ncbi:MAG TPA: HAD-IA family hydrolase [Actinomycetota bacterium]|jgi:HAD superfamily hydrolase (TIGR01509 family)